MKQIDEYLLKSNQTIKNRLNLQQKMIDDLKNDVAREKTTITSLHTHMDSLKDQIDQRDKTIHSLRERMAMFDETKEVLKQLYEVTAKNGLFANDQNGDLKNILDKIAK